MKFIVVGAVIVITIIALKALSLISKRFHTNLKHGKRIRSLEPLLVFFIWTSIAFWAMFYLFYDKPYYNFIIFSLIVVIGLAIGWFFIKDMIAGIAFKAQNQYMQGDLVQFGNIEGKIEALLSTHVSIYTNDGKLIKIPYSNLSNKVISQKSKSGTYGKNHFTIKIKKGTSKEIIEQINSILTCSPWRVKGRKAKIKIISETDNFNIYEILVETRSEKHLDYIKSFINKELKKVIYKSEKL